MPPRVVEARGVAAVVAQGAQVGLERVHGPKSRLGVIVASEADRVEHDALHAAEHPSRGRVDTRLSELGQRDPTLSTVPRAARAGDEAELLEGAQHAADDGCADAEVVAQRSLRDGPRGRPEVLAQHEHEVETGGRQAEGGQGFARDPQEAVEGALGAEGDGIHGGSLSTARATIAAGTSWCRDPLSTGAEKASI